MKGASPFKISKHKTAIARYLFPVRRTFVAPTLPEPIFLISPWPNNLVNIKAKGIDFDTLSISELELYILDLEAEIIKCKNFIVSKSKDKELAESVFKKK